MNTYPKTFTSCDSFKDVMGIAASSWLKEFFFTQLH